MSLPIESMLRDADAAWKLRELGPAGGLLGDLSCHVRALAEEVERLRRALAVPDDRESEDLREALRSEMIIVGGKAHEEAESLKAELAHLKSQHASTKASHGAAKTLALRAARQRNLLTRMCVHSNRPGEWWAFVGNFGPVPYASLVKRATEEEAKAIVREAAAAFATTEEPNV